MHMVHRHHMSVRMSHMNASIKHRYALDLIQPLHSPRQALCATGDPRCQILRQILEPDMMCFGDDKNMARPDRMQVQKGQDVIVLIHAMSGQISGRDPAKQATVIHLFVFHPPPSGPCAAYLVCRRAQLQLLEWRAGLQPPYPHHARQETARGGASQTWVFSSVKARVRSPI